MCLVDFSLRLAFYPHLPSKMSERVMSCQRNDKSVELAKTLPHSFSWVKNRDMEG